MKQKEYEVSMGLHSALEGLLKFLKKNKRHSTLQCNIYTIARNVLNSSNIDISSITHLEKKKFREDIMAEIAYLTYKVPIEVTFYKPNIPKPNKVVIKRKATKLSLKKIVIYEEVAKLQIRYKQIDTKAILLTNMLAGILHTRNLILRSFTGDVISVEERYKLLTGKPATKKVDTFLYNMYGDDMVDGIPSKLKKLVTKFFRENSFKDLPSHMRKV